MTINDLRQLVEQSKAMEEQSIEAIQIIARHCRAAYTGLLESGFTSAEALHLVSSLGPYLIGSSGRPA